MKIIGFNISKILIERKEKLIQKPKVTQNIDIRDVTTEKILVSKEEALKIAFQFNINYSEDFAKVEFQGNILLLPSSEEKENFLKEWKDKKLPEDSRLPLFNFIMSKCNVKALALEDELALPLHMPMPRLKPDNK